jgi:predicted transposase YbfD/YdcC
LGQVKVENKSNEITAIPALLELLDITGCIITIDAMGTTTAIAKQIVAKGADYVLSLKANHPTLYDQVKSGLKLPSHKAKPAIEYSYDQRVEAGHHRQENRQVWAVPVAAIPNLYQPYPWAALQSVVMVVRVRHLWNKTTREVQFYLSSLPCDAVQIGRAIRVHWGIENQLHARSGCHLCARMLPVSAQVIVRKTWHMMRRMAISLRCSRRPRPNVVSGKKPNAQRWTATICFRY